MLLIFKGLNGFKKSYFEESNLKYFKLSQYKTNKLLKVLRVSISLKKKGGKKKKREEETYIPFSQTETSALAPQAFGSLKASSWVMLGFFNMSALLKMSQKQLESSETISFNGKQQDGAGSAAVGFKYS
ncbi:hypothetical protein PanWU01x14_264630 [Parasponia andersonii]|uniref:Uncharacterized protein n=1 Tax=Parasponia andersonii TaxID=3476 RepID=A0A2P5B7A1_PARAD|nr:hypothetical protein PanWU01x14_264630 [Parasponia andersonii]